MMKIKKTKGYYIFQILNTFAMLTVMLLTLYPILYVVFASLSDSDALIRLGGKLLFAPINPNIEAYKMAFANPNIVSGYLNTIFVVVFGVLTSMVLSTIGAYFLSRKNIMLQKPITILIMITMWFSGGLIPLYVAVKDVNLLGSLWSLILPTAISTYNMIILRTGFAAVPDSIVESAYIDGAGHIRIMASIVIPLAQATLAVVALYYAVSYWNAWFNASIFLQGKTEKWPMQLVLRQILIANDTDSMTQGVGDGDKEKIGDSIKYAIIIISTLPILCIYPFIQRYFVQGVMIGAVKG